MKKVLILSLSFICAALNFEAQACPGRMLGYHSAEKIKNDLLKDTSDTELAFIGKVVKSKALWFPFKSHRFSKYDRKTKFKVSKTLKGEPKKQRIIFHSASDNCYGVDFPKEDMFLVVPQKFKNKWVVSINSVGLYDDSENKNPL